MSQQVSQTVLDQVLQLLQQHPGGLSIEELATALAKDVSRRTLQRRLAEWSRSGEIRASGIRRGRRYLAPVVITPATGTIALQGSAPDVRVEEGYVPLSAAGAEIRALVRRPIVDRPVVTYERGFLDRYVPNDTSYLPPTLLRHLHELGRTPNGTRPAGTYAREILSRLLIDLSWASSRLEGNTYSLLDTQQLIQNGTVAPGKDAKETQMILNHKAAIELVVDSAPEVGINRYTVFNLHAVLADNLLGDPRQAGRLRTTRVSIGASTYLPLEIPQRIEEMFSILLEKAAAIRDAFEQSFFLLVHLPYLQPFIDVNKRTSRLAANIPFIRSNLVPLSFIDVPEQPYIDGLIGIYESNRFELLRDVFAWAYERSSRRYRAIRDTMPEPDPFRLKYRAAIGEILGDVVRQRLEPDSEKIAVLSRRLVPEADLKRFTDLVAAELEDIHEGNIARYGLRPSELKAWQERTR
jgi:hypothetical protein